MAPFRIEPLAKGHDRGHFDCGSDPLNQYFARQVGQDVRRRVAVCFVAVDTATDCVAGFYTLAAGSVVLSDLPDSIARKLPRYPSIPIVRIGRLAVDASYQGHRLGAALLFDAVKRSIDPDIAAFALVVDAKDESAIRFYEKHGFEKLTSKSDSLFLPLGDALKKLARGQS